MRPTFPIRLVIVIAVWLTSVHVRADDAKLFGKNTVAPGESALTGIFYDLKQTPEHQPVPMNEPIYFSVMEDFVKKGWDEDVLNKFYRAPTPLYTTQFFLPDIPSTDAPKAFGVEKYCQGGFWLAHYKAQVTPPHDGTYRFVGWADCQIFIAVNGKLVMASPYWKDKPNLGMEGERMSAPYPGGEAMMAGQWVDFKKADPADLDVMWGDNGGECSCFLQIQEKGVNYEMNGPFPILPIFQVAPYDTPNYPASRYAPKFSHVPCIFTALQ